MHFISNLDNIPNPDYTEATNAYLAVCGPCKRPVRKLVDQEDQTGQYLYDSCAQCGGGIRFERLHAVVTTETCNVLCMGATGPSCSCACGGQNHGGAYTVTRGEAYESAVLAYQAKQAKLQEARDAKAAKVRADRAAAFTAWVEDADAGELVAWLDGQATSRLDFLVDMADRVADRRPLTERQQAAATRLMVKDKARAARIAAREQGAAAAKANGITAPTGKHTIEVTISSYVQRNSPFAYNRTEHKLVCEHADGWTTWITLPAALKPSTYTGGDATQEGSWMWHMRALEGRRVRFTAEFTAAKNDTLTSYGKRLTKVELLP